MAPGGLRRRQPGQNVAAISLSTQGSTFLPVNAAGVPLRLAIVWNDQRAVEQWVVTAMSGEPDFASGLSDLACVGVAIMVGTGCGLFDSMEEGYRKMAVREQVIYPDKQRAAIYASLLEAYKNRPRHWPQPIRRNNIRRKQYETQDPRSVF